MRPFPEGSTALPPAGVGVPDEVEREDEDEDRRLLRLDPEPPAELEAPGEVPDRCRRCIISSREICCGISIGSAENESASVRRVGRALPWEDSSSGWGWGLKSLTTILRGKVAGTGGDGPRHG